jgi:hypothetical protein
VAAEVGYARVNADDRAPHGWLAGGTVQYGINETWAVRGSATRSWHTVHKDDQQRPEGTVRTTSAMVGATYAIDVLRFVPYFEMEVGLLRIDGALREGRGFTGFGVEFGLGGEYFLSKKWTVGALARYDFSPQQLWATFPPDLGTTSFFFSFTLTASRIF